MKLGYLKGMCLRLMAPKSRADMKRVVRWPIDHVSNFKVGQSVSDLLTSSRGWGHTGACAFAGAAGDSSSAAAAVPTTSH